MDPNFTRSRMGYSTSINFLSFQIEASKVRPRSQTGPSEDYLPRARADQRVDSRLGLGANVGAREKQDAADRKLREQMLGKGANLRRGDQAELVVARPVEDAQSESDEEESRTRSVKSKTTTKTTKLQQPTPPTSTKPTSTLPSKRATPAAPPPATVAPDHPAAPPSDDDTAPEPTAAATADPSSKASKNKRKKEREKERLALAKRQKMAESRAEDHAARAAALGQPPAPANLAEASPVPSDAVSSTLRSPTVSVVGAASPALASPVVPAARVVAALPATAAEEEGSDEEMGEAGDVSMASAGGAGGAGGEKKKKKRRQKKKGKAVSDESTKPVLDLTPAAAVAV